MNYSQRNITMPEQEQISLYFQLQEWDGTDTKRYKRYLEDTGECVRKVAGIFHAPDGTVTDVFISLIQDYYFICTKNAEYKKKLYEESQEKHPGAYPSKNLTECMAHAYKCPPRMLQNPEAERFICNPYTAEKGHDRLCDLVMYEFNQACQDYIKENMEDNFYKTLPSRQEKWVLETIKIMKSTFNRILADIEHMFAGANAVDNAGIKRLAAENRTLRQQVRQQEKEISNSNSIISSLKKTNEDLTRKIQEKNKDQVSLQEYKELERRYRKLEKKLTDKPEPGSDVMVDELSQSVQGDLPEKDLDINGNYIFCVDTDQGVCKRLMKEFPNSKCVDSVGFVNAQNTDMMVVLSKNISHSVYNKMRQECANKNIPFIHCPYTNIDIIKRIMQKYI